MNDIEAPTQPSPDTAGTPNVPLKDFAELQQQDLMDFSKARITIKSLVDKWKSEVDDTDERRKTRDINIDVQALRNDGSLDEDETLIPDRVIDENITREQPPFINYLKNSRRLGIFNCISNPSLNAQPLELEFTRVMSYTGWETPHYKCLDGAQTHGWDAIEVVYDTSKPANVGLEQIGHDKLYFPRTTVDLQAASEIIRAYDITMTQLQNFVIQFGFDEAQVSLILSALTASHKEEETVRIYKRFKKVDGVVWVSWFSLQHGVNDWLKKPAKLFLGIKQSSNGSTTDSDVKMYPVFILPYRETEKPRLTDRKGRVFLDENKQEAQTAILSGFVNGITRASNIYASPAGEDGTGGSIKELDDVVLHGGRVLSQPMKFWAPPYPDPMIITALQYFDTTNAQETGQTNFAAMNREDSRKTAKEITAAQTQQSLLNSVQLTLFSTHIRSIYSFVWLIVQSQAIQGAIKFLQISQQQPIINPVTNAPVPDQQTGQPMTQTVWVNDIDTLKQVFDVRAAGDVDVIQKDETVAKMKQDWPVVATTVLKDTFLADLIRLEYPDNGEKYAKILEQQGPQLQQLQQFVGHMATTMASLLKDNPDVMQKIPQDQQNVLANMIQQGLQSAQQPTQGQPTQ